MLDFGSDYLKGACPEILKKLSEINTEANTGYGLDKYCKSAEKKILEECSLKDGKVYFLTGGTQMNKTVISSVLRPYEGVFAAESGHIFVHEGGAIENSGHKVLTLKNDEGKVLAEDVESFMKVFLRDETHPHMVQPGMVYISQPTELGTLYSLEELRKLREVCDRYGLKLYADGARCGYALASPENDVTLKDLAEITDLFYIGGTKVGALFGEALVIRNTDLLPNFFTSIKLNGALLAKGWLLGLQFDVLFTDGLYRKISEHAIKEAMKIKKALSDKGYRFFIDSPTNQQFVIVPIKKMEELKDKVSFDVSAYLDDENCVIRLVTSWSTDPEQTDELIRLF